MQQRIQYFDFLRGLAIMMVIAIHTYSIEKGDVALAIRQIFNCAVPLFLAISGYFLAHKDVSTTDNYRKFLKKQLPKVYIPVLIWSFPLFVLNLISGGSLLGNTIMLFICGFSIYYFVALVMQYYILLPCLQKVTTVNGGG